VSRSLALLVIIVLATSATFAASAASAQMAASDQAVIDAYRAAIGSAEAGAAGRVEAAFSAVESVRQVLMRGQGAQGNVLESLSGDEYSRVAHLPGLVVNREEVVFVNPDADYFAKLAAARGDAADRAFFRALKATYPDSVWPVYVDQQTDYSGCTRFGSGTLVGAYRSWSDFQRRFPARYRDPARKEIDEVTMKLAESTCACGDLASVQNELQRFLAAFPASPIGAKVTARLQAARAGRAGIRPNCASG
jgi:hypothetical protein